MLTTPRSSREFYERLDEVSAKLSSAGCMGAAKRLHVILHVCGFTTGNEVYFEIEQAVREILLGKFESDLPIEIRSELLFYFDWMDTLDYRRA